MSRREDELFGQGGRPLSTAIAATLVGAVLLLIYGAGVNVRLVGLLGMTLLLAGVTVATAVALGVARRSGRSVPSTLWFALRTAAAWLVDLF